MIPERFANGSCPRTRARKGREGKGREGIKTMVLQSFIYSLYQRAEDTKSHE